MSFENSDHQAIDISRFKGGFMKSRSYPVTNDDFLFQDKENDTIVLLSGYIYNREELIKNLGLNGKDIKDPELIYKAFINHGPNFVEKLNGDFAIAIVQPSIDTCYLFRDHMGVRPLAYTIQDETLWFSTDAISLCRIFHSQDEKLNTEPLLKYFKFVDYSQLPNNNVIKLLPGHYLKFVQGKVQVHKYWYPEKIKTDKSLSRKQMLNDIKYLLDKAVGNRCDKRYNAGTHLSGGLDSGIVAALAKEKYSHQSKFYGYSWSPAGDSQEELDFDERKLVLDQCKLNDIEPIFIEIDNNDYLRYTTDPLSYSGYFEENKVLEQAHEQNINLIFSGYGGDEFISKGQRGIDTDLFLNFHWVSFITRNPLSKPKSFLRRFLYEIIMPFLGLLTFPTRKMIKSETRYLKKEHQKPDIKCIRNFYLYKSRRKLHLGFLYCYYMPDRMEDWFVNGIRNGIEYRYPLLDKDIVEYMLKVPSKLLFKREYSRTIIREISHGVLPESVRWKKSGLDPVAFNFLKNLVSKAGIEFSAELENFKKNSDLDFIDFNKLEQDIENYKQKPDVNSNEDLLFTIFYIKQLHEFTIAYRN